MNIFKFQVLSLFLFSISNICPQLGLAQPLAFLEEASGGTKFVSPKGESKPNLYPTRSGAQVALLTDGEQNLAVRLQMLDRATETIDIQTLIFSGDFSGTRVAEKLIAAKKRGVQVRVNVDALSNADVDTKNLPTTRLYMRLLKEGIDFRGFSLFGRHFLSDIFEAKHFAEINYRFHDKMWIIDGATDHGMAVVGGRNVADEYFHITKSQIYEHPEKMHWRDQDVVVKGQPLVRDMLRTFNQNYADAEAREKKYFSSIDKKDNWLRRLLIAIDDKIQLTGADPMESLNEVIARAMERIIGLTSRQQGKRRVRLVETVEESSGLVTYTEVPIDENELNESSDEEKPTAKQNRLTEAEKQEVRNQLTQLERRGDLDRLKFAATTARWFQSRPRLGETYIEQLYISMIKEARKSIDMMNAYFIPSPQMTEALSDAAKRGVRVRIFTNSTESIDVMPILCVAGRLHYQALMSGNHRQCEAMATSGGLDAASPGLPNSAIGCLDIYEWKGPETVHAKFGLFDDTHLIVGSYNIDPRSLNLNSETVLLFSSNDLGSAMADQLGRIDLPKAKRVSQAQADDFSRKTSQIDRAEIQKIIAEIMSPNL